MNPRPTPFPLLLGTVLAVAAAGLALLLAGAAGDRKDMHPLPGDGARTEILPDPDRRLAWPDVLALPANDWEPWTRSTDYIHIAKGGAIWVRVTLANPSPDTLTGVIADAEFNLDRLDCWTPDAAEPTGWRQRTAGEIVPAHARDIWGRQPAFYVTVPPQGETVIYLRAHDRFSVWFRAVWWPEARAFHAAQLRGILADAIYFGILIALLVYNTVLWVRLRYRDLGFYLGYLGSVALFMSLLRSQTYLLGLPLIPPAFDMAAAATLASSGFFMAQFGREFLGLSTISPRFDQIARSAGRLNLVILLGSVCVLWSTTTAWVQFAVITVVITHGILVAAAFVAWRRGAGHARYFLLSFGLFFAGSVPYAWRWQMAVPLGQTALFVLLGSALEMLLLSLMLADRFARLEHERFSAQLSEEKARLALLRYQLNPHFLFNALNSIYGLVYPHSRAAGDLVRRLADFCRETFTGDATQWRPLAEELATLRLYLDLEQARWQHRLAVEFSADSSVADTRLPAFLLLPLVENAIKHGGATSPDVLSVRVATRPLDADTTEIEIANTGRWLAPDEPRTSPSHGIGLANLRARLTRNFPGTHRFDITHRDGWVSLLLRLPRHAPARP